LELVIKYSRGTTAMKMYKKTSTLIGKRKVKKRLLLFQIIVTKIKAMSITMSPKMSILFLTKYLILTCY